MPYVNSVSVLASAPSFINKAIKTSRSEATAPFHNHGLGYSKFLLDLFVPKSSSSQQHNTCSYSFPLLGRRGSDDFSQSSCLQV